MALLPWRIGKVIKIEDETYNTRRFWIDVPDTDNFDFKPGQFVTLDLPIDEKPNKRWRSYSIASWPDGTNVYELLIVLNPAGKGTPYLFNHITIDSEIPFRGPLGVFVLPPTIEEKELFLICTGTGVAPFRSMANHIKNHSIPFKKIHLVYGCRNKEDLLYFDELSSLDLPNFQYIPTLSRGNWEGKRGYVHSIYEDLCHEKQPANFYLCGWKNMIDEAKQRIMAMGYDRKSIHQELYG